MTERRPIIDRMRQARVSMVRQCRTPKAFYLSDDDYSEFKALALEHAMVLFRGKPRQEAAFDGLPVRRRRGVSAGHYGSSCLYCTYGTKVAVPVA